MFGSTTQFGLYWTSGANGGIVMNRWILIALIASFPVSALAGTKYLKCKQTTDKGVEQMIYVTIDDSSDKAEVESFALSADCANSRSCGTGVYTKDVLPSVIRLTDVMRAGSSATYRTTIDIDRTTLVVVTRTKLETSIGGSETTAHGQCSVTVDNSEKVL